MEKRTKFQKTLLWFRVSRAGFGLVSVGAFIALIHVDHPAKITLSLFAWIICGLMAGVSHIFLKSLDGLPNRVIERWDRPKLEPIPIDLRVSNAGMSCADFTLLFVAGPAQMPAVAAERMRIHEDDCEYHRSKRFHQSVIGLLVTPEAEKEAQELIARMKKGV